MPAWLDGGSSRRHHKRLNRSCRVPTLYTLAHGGRVLDCTSTGAGCTDYPKGIRMSKLARRTVFATLLALGFSGAASAGAPTQGLGQAWPNAVDVSVNAHYHAYAFVLGGVTYVQINDAAGNVLGAIGTSGGQFIVLPIGNAASVTTPQQSGTATAATSAGSAAVVYNDGTTVISATPMSDGTTSLQAASASTQTASPAESPAVMEQTCDVITCSTHGA